MCGLAAIYAYGEQGSQVDQSEVVALKESLKHRGPDGDGYWISPDLRTGLVHTRLAIIDLDQRASQPMTDSRNNCRIVFNGQIYNYQKLRQDLQKQGYDFKTKSDTEVLLKLYQHYGHDMLHLLRGMFAFVLWDGNKRELFYARDPYGIKPLYCFDSGRRVVLASQVKSLIILPEISREADPVGIMGFCVFGSVPGPDTAYKDIKEVRAGSFGIVQEGERPVERCYFDITKSLSFDRHEGPDSFEKDQTYLRMAVRDSVSCHLVADVPVGVFLSSGIDSGAILGVMRDLMATEIDAITLVPDSYIGSNDDEQPLATLAARQYRGNHVKQIVSDSDINELVDDFLSDMDQPSIDGLNTWLVSRAARENGNKVMLSGLGGDELFGGYPSFTDIPRWVSYSKLMAGFKHFEPIWKKWIRWLGDFRISVNPKAAGFPFMLDDYASAYVLRRAIFLPSELESILSREFIQDTIKPQFFVDYVADKLPSDKLTSYQRVAAMESTVYMRNQLLRDSDWAGMSHGIEIRTPLVDKVLLEKAAPLISRHTSGQGKHILSNAPDIPLTSAQRNRAKTGFTLPMSSWLSSLPQLDTWKRNRTLCRDDTPWPRRWTYTVLSKYFQDNSILAIQ